MRVLAGKHSKEMGVVLLLFQGASLNIPVNRPGIVKDVRPGP